MADSKAENLATLTEYQWSPLPEPANLVRQLLDECLAECPFAAMLSQQMFNQTGTRFVDWIDHFGLPAGDPLLPRLAQVGFTSTPTTDQPAVWTHPGGLFPKVRVISNQRRQLALKVESVVDFLFAQGLTNIPIQGYPCSALRKACVAQDSELEFWIVERHGTVEFETNPDAVPPQTVLALSRHTESFLLRQRQFSNDNEGFAHANRLIDAAIADLGKDRACDLFFAAERAYWQQKNRAGQIQVARQQRLGLGWANHDHHTYRSSRESFVPLIAFLEKLGFRCRERFYAGKEAGWGAQVIEHAVTGVTIFADVDMSPEELSLDFSHVPLPIRNELGTVGLWCALHGEAFLQAGMHHLECQFDFRATSDQLKQAGIETMPPFTDFPYLKQAFTRGEQWAVDPIRVEQLRASHRITDDQAKQFLAKGALGSHLEILQRDDGYKGFNQKGINEIISATDPRRAVKS